GCAPAAPPGRADADRRPSSFADLLAQFAAGEPEVVEPAPPVSLRPAEDDDVDAGLTADATGAIPPRPVAERRLVVGGAVAPPVVQLLVLPQRPQDRPRPGLVPVVGRQRRQAGALLPQRLGLVHLAGGDAALQLQVLGHLRYPHRRVGPPRRVIIIAV